MSYPESRYDGDDGEVTAWARAADAPHDVAYSSGGTADYLATGASTGGLYGLYRWNMGVQPSGPEPHFHRTIAESFYVLEGTVKIYDGREWRPCTPGDFVHVPPGGIHGFRNESGEPASMLLLFTPGAPREAYFEGLARFAVEGRPGPDELARFYAEHDNTWV